VASVGRMFAHSADASIDARQSGLALRTSRTRQTVIFGHGTDTLQAMPVVALVCCYNLLILLVDLVPAGGFEPPTY